MKKALSIALLIVFSLTLLTSCAKKSGDVHSGKVDLLEFTLTYEDKEYTIFAKLGESEDDYRGDYIGCAEPNGEVQVGKTADPENGTYAVYKCVGDDSSLEMLGLDFSKLLVFEYGDAKSYWMAPQDFLGLVELDQYENESESYEITDWGENEGVEDSPQDAE